jgi:microcystin-dependent protein
MSEPFLGEIKVVSFGFPPKGWALCDGQLLPINQNQALFSLLGTTYGGDGRVNFALPNLQGRVPLHFDGSVFVLGERGGEEAHTLALAELAAHSHPAIGSDTPDNAGTPSGNYWGGGSFFATTPIDSPMLAAAITPVGGGQPHENRSPFLTLNFVIALQGIFPSQN